MQRIILLSLLFCLARCMPLSAVEPPKAKPAANAWKSMFDGKALKSWKVVKGIEYEDHGKVEVKNGSLLLDKGDPATGVRWTGKLPTNNYEVALEGQRTKGSDFFCGMSFPVGKGALTLILGGWGGWVVGLSNIDGERAIDNETCQAVEFKNDRWYRIRARVTSAKVEVWLDNAKVIDLDREDHKFNVTFEMEPCLPFGFATWETGGALRNIRYRTIEPKKKAATP